MYLVVQRTSLPLYQQAYKWSLNLKLRCSQPEHAA